MTTYPLTFPNIGIVSSTFRLQSVTSTSTSPFTGEEQVYSYQGQWWEGNVTFKPMKQSEAALVQSFLAKLNGRFGTFLYGDPDNLAKGNQGAGGTILINGADQTGKTLNVDGMTTGATIAKAGDYFQLGTGVSSRLYMFTEDLVSDGSGEGVMTFEPSLRSSPADNATVDVTSPVGAFRLSQDPVEWNSNFSSVYEISVSFREAI